MTNFATQVDALRPQLLRFARAQLRNDAFAEDAVSETVLAALERPQSFAGQSQLKTWLVGILKHKLVDQLRRATREVASSDEETGQLDDALFDATGHWQQPPGPWTDPEGSLGQSQFFQVLELCVDKLPGQLGRVFMMREWLELDTEEICKELQITPTNLWVMLHRARLRLRECLAHSWFADQR
jgi:RNA polymerase sigma-70 factor (TIGR02943 family)